MYEIIRDTEFHYQIEDPTLASLPRPDLPKRHADILRLSELLKQPTAEGWVPNPAAEYRREALTSATSSTSALCATSGRSFATHPVGVVDAPPRRIDRSHSDTRATHLRGTCDRAARMASLGEYGGLARCHGAGRIHKGIESAGGVVLPRPGVAQRGPLAGPPTRSSARRRRVGCRSPHRRCRANDLNTDGAPKSVSTVPPKRSTVLTFRRSDNHEGRRDHACGARSGAASTRARRTDPDCTERTMGNVKKPRRVLNATCSIRVSTRAFFADLADRAEQIGCDGSRTLTERGRSPPRAATTHWCLASSSMLRKGRITAPGTRRSLPR